MIKSRSLLSILCFLAVLLARPSPGLSAPNEHGSAPDHGLTAPAALEANHHHPAAEEHSPQPAESEGPPSTTAEHGANSAHVSPAMDAPSAAAASESKHHEPPAPAGKTPTLSPTEVQIQIKSLLKLGLSLAERSDWDAAEIAFRQILANPKAKDDDLANGLMGLARVYRRQGALTKAVAVYERFLKNYPGSDQAPDALLEVGRAHRALGAHQLAIARFYSVLNSTLKISGEGFNHYQVLAKTAQFEIAETHFQQGKFAEANKFFNRLRLLDLAPSDRARAHFKSAYALYLDDRLENAVTTLHTYLEQWPNDENVPEARNLLAVSLRTLGRKQEALDVTIQLLRAEKNSQDPKRWSYWQRRTGNQLANDFFQNGDTVNALAIYQGLAALAPEPEWRLPVTYQMALCFERLRDSESARAAYQNIIESVAAPETAATAEMKEIARMATWRIGQLNWRVNTDREFSSLFEVGTIKQVPKVVKATTPDNAADFIKPTADLENDHPGNSPKAPSSL